MDVSNDSISPTMETRTELQVVLESEIGQSDDRGSDLPEQVHESVITSALHIDAVVPRNDDHYDDDDDITVILLDEAIENTNSPNSANGFSLNWIEQNGPEMEERRRRILLRELKRIQRDSFIRFAVMCIIPLVLLVVVLATISNANKEPCESDIVFCQLEPRSFSNVFTSRCVCDPIPISKSQAP
jgi:hypothetical protein